MKRDPKLIETILSKLESAETQSLSYNPSKYPYLDLDAKYDKQLVDYHFGIMQDFGLIFIQHQLPENQIRLTWQGHDYLESLQTEMQEQDF